MNAFPLVLATGLFENLPILDIIKTGAAGLAVVVAFLSYNLSKEVIKGKTDKIKAGVAKFSWVASIVLVLLMVGGELFRYINQLPVLGIQANGWNAKEFGAPLIVHIWEGRTAHANHVGTPFKNEITSEAITYEIQGTSPMLTINLEAIMGKMNNQTALLAELTKKVQQIHPPTAADAGPATAP
jgi:hypothetical protein